MTVRPPRIVLAKLGLDGHDRGVHVIARILRDAGFEVVLTGLRCSPAQAVAIAVDEDADLIGLSILSGAHLELTDEVQRCLKARDLRIPVVVGGTIGPIDRERLRTNGVAAVFPVGSPRTEIVAALRDLVDDHSSRSADTASTAAAR
jgi:methylmalonyl-CoA mutase C-terminal domain/subunit